jgi:hypothetical protein
MAVSFVTKIYAGEKKKVAGIVVPEDIVTALGSSRKPAVQVTVNGYTYRSTIAVMGGKFMIPLSAENCRAAGVAGGETWKITVALDTEPRVVAIPADLAAALDKAGVAARFAAAAPSRRKEFVRLVESAKAPETRQRRVQKIVDELSA